MTEAIYLNNVTDEKKNKNSRAFFYIGMALMVFAIFARNIFDISVPVMAVLAIGVLVAAFSDRNEIIALVIACIPMSAAFQYKYLIFICIIIYVVKFGSDIRFTAAIVPLYLMIVWELVHGLFYPFSIYECLRGFSELIFCTFLMMVVPKNTDYKLISRLLAICSICMMSIVLFNMLESIGYDFEAIFVGSYRFGVGNAETENFGVNYNANGLGMIANLSIAGLLQLIAAKRHNIFDYLMIVVLVMFGVMTMSRAFLLCFVLLIILFAVSGASTLWEKAKRIIAIVLLVALLILLVYSLMPTIYERFVDRFRADDVTNGRTELFAFYNEHISSGIKNMFFGIGAQNYGDKIMDMYPDSTLGANMDVCHNGIQELIVCWGIPGLILFSWFLIEMIRHKKDGPKRGIVNYIPLLLILFYVQSGQLITSGNSLLALCFAYISIKTNFKVNKDETIL